MTAQELIEAIMARYPDALRSELAEVFLIDEVKIVALIRKAKLPSRKRAMQRPKDQRIIRDIRRFADNLCGGHVELIPIRGEPVAVCVNGRLAA
jgi:hypothetical protein